MAMNKIKGKMPSPSLAADESFKLLVNAWADYKKTAEIESTKRESIRAWRDTRLAEIEAQRAVLETYLQGMFKERATMIDGLFRTLDAGIAQGDVNVVNSAIGGIVAIAKESPLASAREMIAAIHDPDVKLIEI